MPLTQLDSSPALTNRDADSHQLTVEKIFPRIGETTTTDDVLKRLQEAASVGTNAVVGK
jgi:hypothetical protein